MHPHLFRYHPLFGESVAFNNQRRPWKKLLRLFLCLEFWSEEFDSSAINQFSKITFLCQISPHLFLFFLSVTDRYVFDHDRCLKSSICLIMSVYLFCATIEYFCTVFHSSTHISYCLSRFSDSILHELNFLKIIIIGCCQQILAYSLLRPWGKNK